MLNSKTIGDWVVGITYNTHNISNADLRGGPSFVIPATCITGCM